MTEPHRIQFRMILRVARDLLSLISSALRSPAKLAAEHLFLQKPLALYLERQVKPSRADDATRITLVALSRFVAWRRLLTIVTPDTLIRWHRKGFRLFGRWKSRTWGRPPIPADVQQLIASMAAANRTWGEERIAAELLVTLEHSSLAPYRETIYAIAPTAREPRDTDVEHVRPKPRTSGARE